MIKKYPIRNKSGKEQYIITSTLNERAVKMGEDYASKFNFGAVVGCIFVCTE